MRSQLVDLEKTLIDWQFIIIKVFQFLEISVIAAGWIGGSLLIQDYQTYSSSIFQIGQIMGSFALLLYSITLVPGIFRRLQIKTKYTMPIADILVIFRRHFGILMFLLLFVHLMFVFVFPLAAQGRINQLFAEMKFGQIWGFLAWLLLVPLWITSNETAVQLLGKWRDVIHRGTYLILICLFLYALYLQSILAILLLIAVISLVVSWIREYHLSSSK